MSKFDKLEKLKKTMVKGEKRQPVSKKVISKKKVSKKKASKKKDMDLNSDGTIDQKDVEILEKVIVEAD